MPTVIKDTQYWKEYNAKRKDYIRQKNKERYLKSSINTLNRDTTEINTTDTTKPQSKIIQPVINTTYSINTTDNLIQPKEANEIKINTTKKQIQPPQELIQPKNIKLVEPVKLEKAEVKEIEKYNELVYQRAGTRDPQRFFTFPDGRKIVRTKCGCVLKGNNGIVNIYDWCRDDCAYFTNWREINKPQLIYLSVY